MFSKNAKTAKAKSPIANTLNICNTWPASAGNAGSVGFPPSPQNVPLNPANFDPVDFPKAASPFIVL
jgi:hypothetical protein